MATIIIYIPTLLEHAGLDKFSEFEARRVGRYITKLGADAERIGHSVESSSSVGPDTFYSVSGEDIDGALEFMMRDHVGDLLTIA